jgi:hypothetical protein
MTDRSDASVRSQLVPKEVGLYGLGYYTQAILELCRDAGIRVAFIVDDRPEIRPWHDPARVCLAYLRHVLTVAEVSLWSEETFRAKAESGEPLPPLLASSIVGGSGGTVDDDPYLHNTRHLRDTLPGKVSLWHPVILAHAVDLPEYSKRVALFGFAGSGNILARHLLGALEALRNYPVPPRTELVAVLAEHYYRSTLTLLWHVLRDLQPQALELAVCQFPTSNLTLALPAGEYALAQHIPCNRHLSAFFYHTHGMPTRPALDALTRLGTACFAVVRHPCETLLSWLAKVSRPPTPVLDNGAVFREVVALLAEWYRQLHANADRLTVVRYEDLEARQARPLRALAERLGVPLSDAEIDSVYDRFLHRDLLPEAAPGHYFRGGNDKWKQFFLPRHVRQMKAAGFGPICERWGYELTRPTPSISRRGRREGGPSGQKTGALPLGALYRLNREQFASGPYPLLIHSRSREVNRLLQDVLLGPEFLTHLSAGGLGPDSPPWVPPIPWETLTPIYLPGRQRRWPNLARLLQRLSSSLALRGGRPLGVPNPAP